MKRDMRDSGFQLSSYLGQPQDLLGDPVRVRSAPPVVVQLRDHAPDRPVPQLRTRPRTGGAARSATCAACWSRSIRRLRAAWVVQAQYRPRRGRGDTSVPVDALVPGETTTCLFRRRIPGWLQP